VTGPPRGFNRGQNIDVEAIMANGMSDALEVLSENWWAVALRGLVAIMTGIVAFLLPVPTMIALVWLFGAYAFLDGLFNLISVLRRRRTRSRPWWALVLSGIAGIATGVISFVWPGITALAWVYLIAAWALITGVLEIVAAVRLRKEIKGEWLLALSGVFSVLLGVLLAIAPGPGAIALVWYLGTFAIFFGVLIVALSFRLRGRQEEMRAHRAHAAA
jgi:uncharacterized membrane protein HdeD (DUF308 family)